MSDTQKIINNVRTFKEEFLRTPVLSTKGQTFNQKQLIEFIEKYYDSQYLDGDKDYDAYRFFYNIVKFPVRLAAKMIDLDTKDIRFIAEDGQSHVPVWCMNKELKAWMKDQQFGITLNQIVQNVPKYGNYVLKVVQDQIKPVRLVNLINDPFVEELEQSAVVIEEHYMTPNELRAQKGWKNVEEVIAMFEKSPNDSFIRVDEIYAYGKVNGKYGRNRVIVAGLDDVELDAKENVLKDNMVILNDATPINELPYFEFFWEEFSGRWLRIGVVEDLFEEQFRTNDTINLQAQGLHWTSKHIYQTRDMTAQKNLMYGVENGALLRVNSEITPIMNEERNLAAFNVELQAWDKNRREKTFTLEAVSGETLPSATPFRLGAILQNAAGGYFDFKRENIALGIKKLINKHIAPNFMKSKRTKHIFNFYGEDSELSTLEELYVEYEIQKAISAYNGYISQERVDEVREMALQKIRSRSNRSIEVPSGFYDDVKYKIDIVITDESIAMDAKIQTLTTLLQTISTNPNIMEDERSRALVFKIMDYAGISPEELRVAPKSGNPQIPPEMMAKLGAQSPPPGQVKPELQLSSNMRTI